jgi:hypothetical protein
VSTTATTPGPILLATHDSNDVFAFWTHHKQCGVHNRVELLADGEDVLRYLESTRLNYPVPALLVLGLRLPRVGGVQVLERMDPLHRQQFPIVLLIDTRDHDLELILPAYRLHVRAFLMRPIVHKDFCGLMTRLRNAVTMDCPGVKPHFGSRQ